MEIERVDCGVIVSDDDVVRVKEMGNVVELMYQEKRNTKNYIKKISDSKYIDLRTGEVKDCIRTENRIQSVNEVRKS